MKPEGDWAKGRDCPSMSQVANGEPAFTINCGLPARCGHDLFRNGCNDARQYPDSDVRNIVALSDTNVEIKGTLANL
jgi:hypothetical protein